MKRSPLLYIVLFLLYSFFYIGVKGQDLQIDKQLTELKKLNQLDDWLILRMTYAAENPGERIGFLMDTEKEMWRKPTSENEKESWFNLLLNQGYYLLYSGNITGSINVYEEADRYFKENPVPDFDIAEYLYKPLGNNYTRLGDYTSALYIQKEGLEHALKNNNREQAASFYNNLAISYRWLGNLHEAGQMALSGLNMIQTKKSDGLRALLLSTLADIEFEQGNTGKAYQTIQTALKLLSGNSNSANENYWLLSALTLAGNIALDQNRLLAAREYYTKGLVLIKNKFADSRKREKANLLNKLGNVSLITSDGRSALDFFNQSLETLIPSYQSVKTGSPDLKMLYAENRLYDAFEGRSTAFALLKQPENSLADMLMALHSGDLSRSIISSEHDKIYYQKNYNKLAESALNTAYSLWQSTKNRQYAETVLQIVEQSKARVLMDEIMKNRRQLLSASDDSLFKKQLHLQQAIAQYETDIILDRDPDGKALENKNRAVYELSVVEKELMRLYPSLQSEMVNSQIIVRDLLEKVPEGTVVFNYFFGETNGYNVIIENKEISHIARLEDMGYWKERIEGYVSEFFRKGPGAMVNKPQEYFRASQELYNYLIPNGLFSSERKLLVIPDDVAGYLSFDALIGAGDFSDNIKNWPFLINTTRISYAYSLSSRALPARKSGKGNFSGFFVTKGAGDNMELPAATLEEKYLSSLIRGAFFLNDKARLETFESSITKSDVLHVSTHSFPSGEDRVPTLEMADGNYFLFQLNKMQVIPSLVVMSACRTADGLLATGEGILSLSRGFAAAGTDGTVAGLWNLNDEAAALQMADFYKILLEESDPEAALYKMKKNWLETEHDNPILLMPYYWAGMVYTGKPQEIHLERAGGLKNYMLWILVGLTTAGFSIYFFRRRKRILNL